MSSPSYKFDSSGFDCVVFDEIYFSCVMKLSMIKRYCDKNHDKIVIATGDTDQLEPIELLTNQFNYNDYANHCVNTIFNYEIFLKVPKRVKTDEDKEKLKEMSRN